MCMIINNFKVTLKLKIFKIPANGVVFVIHARLMNYPIKFSAMNVKSPLTALASHFAWTSKIHGIGQW